MTVTVTTDGRYTYHFGNNAVGYMHATWTVQILLGGVVRGSTSYTVAIYQHKDAPWPAPRTVSVSAVSTAPNQSFQVRTSVSWSSPLSTGQWYNKGAPWSIGYIYINSARIEGGGSAAVTAGTLNYIVLGR